jgi:hypothetical protein
MVSKTTLLRLPSGRPQAVAVGLGVALFVLGLSVWLYAPTIRLLPSHHHAWAQADWMALALNFRQRGFDFFHPATYNLLTRDGVTGAGFPLPAYLTAVLMQVAGSEAPGLMRLFTLGCSLGGLAALFGLVQRASGSAWRAGLAVLFGFCSPLYGYYQAGFLPSVPAFAAALAGYYSLYRLGQAGARGGASGRWLAATVSLLALAAAIRTPFAIPLLVSILHVAWWRWSGRLAGLGWAQVVGAYGAALLFVGGYFYYNEYLTRQYGGSMFLARPLPFGSVAEAWETTGVVAAKWGLDLLSRWQWLALGGAVLGALGSQPPRAWLGSVWRWHWLLLALGGGAYYVLMGPQYLDHDYYFIDSLLLPLVLLFAGALSQLRVPPAARPVAAAAAAGLVVLWVQHTHAVQRQRYVSEPGDRGMATLTNFTGSANLLDALKVPRTARVMVLDAYSFNGPLLLMQRRGWTVLTTSEENLQASFEQPAELVVTQNQFFESDIINNYPLLTERLDSVFSDGYLTFWRPRRAPVPIVWQQRADLETLLDSASWKNQQRSDEQAASGRFSARVAEDAATGLTFARPVGTLGLQPHDRLVVHAKCWLPTEADYSAKLVVSLASAGGSPYYEQALDCRRYQGPPGRWTVVGDSFRLPAAHAPTDVLQVSLRKEGHVAVWLDDLTLTLVR